MVRAVKQQRFEREEEAAAVASRIATIALPSFVVGVAAVLATSGASTGCFASSPSGIASSASSTRSSVDGCGIRSDPPRCCYWQLKGENGDLRKRARNYLGLLLERPYFFILSISVTRLTPSRRAASDWLPPVD